MAKKKRSFAPFAAVVIGGVLAVIAVAYLSIHFAAGDHIPANTVISGVKVGGLEPAAALAKVHSELDPRIAQNITVNTQGKSVEINPTEISLAINYPATFDKVGGGVSSWNPIDNLNQLFGGITVDAVLTYDTAALTDKLDVLAAEVNVEPIDATLAFVDGKPKATDAVNGQTLDIAATIEKLVMSFMQVLMVDAVVLVTEPAITTAEADEVVEKIATPAAAEKLTVNVADKGKFTLDPQTVTATLTFEAQNGSLVPVFNEEILNQKIAKSLDKLGLQQPVNAKFSIAGKKSGKPKIVDSKDGVGIDIKQLSSELVTALENGERTVSVGVASRPADFTKADAEAMGVKKIIGEFTTYFPGSAYRYNNIGKAAKLINGTFLAPGEQFSMNKTLGERTKKNGWMKGGGIADGKIQTLYGGGISQATTTTFNAVFFAGLKDIYHKPHSLYFSRYPMGREATLDWKMVDMKFENDSEYGVLMQAWITGKTGSQGSITVRIWSTKTYTIKASKPVTSNYRSPGDTIYDTSAGCVAQSAMSGFSVKYNRLFYKDKELVKTEPFKWTYNTLTPVVCGKKPEK